MRPKVRVIGVDPGKTTGLMLLNDDDVVVQVAATFVEVEEVLRLWLSSEIVTIVAVERFVITRNTARKTQQTDALKVSGVVQNLVERSRLHEVVYQNMSDAKKLGSPTMLRALGWYRVGRNARHMNDAASQVFKLVASRYPDWVHLHVTPDII